jgi:hypothetical protein
MSLIIYKKGASMNFKYRPFAALVLTVATLVLVSTRLPADTGTCGGAMVTLPFTDVSGNIFFCQIAEGYFSGLTSGTTPTTYSLTILCVATRWLRSPQGRRIQR